MIDTIVFRIHNAKDYEKLFNQLYVTIKQKNTIVQTFIDSDTAEIIQNDKTLLSFYLDSGHSMPVNFRGTYNIPSHHYSVAYSYNYGRNFWEFNLSIPKFVYSTNVIQFLNINNISSSSTYYKLLDFLFEFMRKNFIEQPSLTDIEINRIDICYNQFFNSKQDALIYLDHIKTLKHKFAKANDGNSTTPYETSHMYKTKSYSFKIYHKGTEFRKNDYKELIKNGNPYNINLSEMLDVSDKILRYELTLRCKGMNYLAKKNFFVSKTFSDDTNYKFHPVVQFWEDQMRKSKGLKQRYKKDFNRTKKFVLQSAYETKNIETIEFANDYPFDIYTFDMFYNFFLECLNMYQIRALLSPTQVDLLIRDKLESASIKNGLKKGSAKVPQRSRLMAFALLAQYSDITELKRYVPRSTYYKITKSLRELGINEKDRPLCIPQPSLDYNEYKIYFSKYH